MGKKFVTNCERITSGPGRSRSNQFMPSAKSLRRSSLSACSRFCLAQTVHLKKSRATDFSVMFVNFVWLIYPAANAYGSDLGNILLAVHANVGCGGRNLSLAKTDAGLSFLLFLCRCVIPG